MKNKEIVLGLLLCVFVLVVVHFMNNDSNNDIAYYPSEEKVNENVDEETLDDPIIQEVNYQEMIKSLQDENNNKDIKAVLRISNTDYSSIVPQGNDNSYYLKHLPNKKYSRFGSTYLDYRVDIEKSSKLLIYGHNSSKYSMPFDILENFYDKDYLNSHKYIELITENGVKNYEIFSVYVEVKDYAYYQKLEFDNKNDWYQHIKRMKDKSLYDTGVSINEDDNILILQTCSTHKNYQKYAKKYLLIISKEVMVNEIN